MKTIYLEVKDCLENSHSARERRFRVKAMRELVLRKLGLENQMFIGPDDLDKVLVAFESYMREWRHVMTDCPELHGSDYGDKEALEQRTVLDLGYEVGYEGDLKLAKQI